MTRDGLLENYAIEIPGGAHLVINTSTAPIIYNKGGSILRQIQGYIGPDIFKKGCGATSTPTPTNAPTAATCGTPSRPPRSGRSTP